MPDVFSGSENARSSPLRWTWPRRLVSGGLGVLLGWLLWATSGPVAVPPYSEFGLGPCLGGAALAGMFATLPCPDTPGLGSVAVWLGQVAYIAVSYVPALPTDPMIFAPFVLVLFFGAVPPMIGVVPVLLLWRGIRG